MPVIHVDIMPLFRAGDPVPSGYNEWHEWAEIQYKAGLRQSKCSSCSLWFFPQELTNGVCDKCAPSKNESTN